MAAAHTDAAKVEAMIMQWAGVADVHEQSRGIFTDGQYVAAVEAVNDNRPSMGGKPVAVWVVLAA